MYEFDSDLDEDLVYNKHNNDIGDWCPWSGMPFRYDEDPDDAKCPAGCRQSHATEPDTGDGDA